MQYRTHGEVLHLHLDRSKQLAQSLDQVNECKKVPINAPKNWFGLTLAVAYALWIFNLMLLKTPVTLACNVMTETEYDSLLQNSLMYLGTEYWACLNIRYPRACQDVLIDDPTFKQASELHVLIYFLIHYSKLWAKVTNVNVCYVHFALLFFWFMVILRQSSGRRCRISGETFRVDSAVRFGAIWG